MRSRIALRVGPFLAVVQTLLFAVPSFSSAQLLARLRSNEPEIISAVAYSGEQFGVGRIVFKAGNDPLVLQTAAIRISERNSRIHYPAFSEGLTRIFAESGLLDGGVQTVWFLFKGNQPLDVILDASIPIETRIEVIGNRPFIAKAVKEVWWTQFNLQMKRQMESGDYPELAEVYLTSMLSNRLGLQRPFLITEKNRDENQFRQTTDLIFDVESVRVQAIRDMMKGQPRRMAQGGTQVIPLPQPAIWQQFPPMYLDDGVEIEPMAHVVPEECFYVRFGTWDNQIWLKRLMDEHSSDLGRMVSMRGHKAHSETKMLDQLVLESSQIDEMFGGQLISDIAFIGRDFYIDDGPSIGVLFQSKNGLFETNMRARRKRFARANSDKHATLETETIDGQEVSILATPDNRIRSFYAVHENFHLITTSRTIVARFFQAAKGDRSLALNSQFRYARAELPVSRDDTIFIYLSTQFLEAILSPRYQIELARRNRSLASIQLLQMASWAAESEGFKTDSIENMQLHGFLPENYGVQPDGSSISFVEDQWQDSMRGRRGYFTPISDVSVDSISSAESSWLDERLHFYQNELGSMNPIFAGIKRYEAESDRGTKVERVIFDARVAPFNGKQWDALSDYLGPPMQSEIAMSPADLIGIQISLKSLPFLSLGQSEPHQLFAAIQSDISPTPPPLGSGGFFQTLKIIKSIPGYVGAWPSPGYLDKLPALGGRPDERGFTYSRLLGLWRMQHGDFSVVSFDRDRLEFLRPNLAVIPAERPAQLRLRVGDIANSNLRNWVNSLYYQQGWETSLANVRFINMISQQFGVPLESSLEAAEDFLDVDLICPLEGQYELVKLESGRNAWHSNSWPPFGNPSLPRDFEAPPLSWFRGMSMDVYQQDSQFVVHGILDIERQNAGAAASILPSFNLFKGFDKLEELPPALAPAEIPGENQNDKDKKPKSDNETLLKPPKRDQGTESDKS